MHIVEIKGNMIPAFEKIGLIVPIDKGELFVMPTDTLWGLGVCISNPQAVKNLFRVKKRPLNIPLPMFPADIQKAFELTGDRPSPLFRQLAEKFWPGPLTIIVQSELVFPEGLYSFGNRIGLRIPNHPIAREIVDISRDRVLAVTSANLHGKPEPLTIEEIDKQIGEHVKILIQSDFPMSMQPSTVIDISRGELVVLREGAISKKEILNVS